MNFGVDSPSTGNESWMMNLAHYWLNFPRFERRWSRSVASHVHEPHGQRDLVAPGTAGLALAIPTLANVGEQCCYGRRETESVGQHLPYLADCGHHALELPGCPRSPRASCEARTSGAPSGGATARSIPAIICGRDPNLTGVAYVVSPSSPKISAAISAVAVQPT